jgi:hypothetical protein
MFRGLIGHHQVSWNSGELLRLPRCCDSVFVFTTFLNEVNVVLLSKPHVASFFFTSNNTNSTVYATVFINFGYTTCFDSNGSSSDISSYTLFTYWIATWDSHIPIYIHRSWSGYAYVSLHTIWGYCLSLDYCINLTFQFKLLLIFSWF